MSKRECIACGSRESETPFPTVRRRGDPVLCCDCRSWPGEAARLAQAALQARQRIMTRASYRAALRARQASPQGDLVDLVVACP